MRRRSLLSAAAALALAACGEVSVDEIKGKAADGLLDPATIAAQLPPEARSVVTSYQGDLRAAATAYHAEFGRWPASFAELPTMASAREAAITLVADGLAEQVPFASRATVEQAASGFVTAAKRRILSQMSGDNAANP